LFSKPAEAEPIVERNTCNRSSPQVAPSRPHASGSAFTHIETKLENPNVGRVRTVWIGLEKRRRRRICLVVEPRAIQCVDDEDIDACSAGRRCLLPLLQHRNGVIVR